MGGLWITVVSPLWPFVRGEVLEGKLFSVESSSSSIASSLNLLRHGWGQSGTFQWSFTKGCQETLRTSCLRITWESLLKCMFTCIRLKDSDFIDMEWDSKVFKYSLIYQDVGATPWEIWWERLDIVQLLSCVQVFLTSWPAACQVPLSFTVSHSLLKFVSIESVMLSNHLILCCPLLLLLSLFPSIRVFSNE